MSALKTWTNTSVALDEYDSRSGPTSGSQSSGFTYDATSGGLFTYDPSVTSTVAPTAFQSLSQYETVSALVIPNVFSSAPTTYNWDPYGRLCNISLSGATPCGTNPTTGTGYTYDGDGLRVSATASASGTTTLTTSTWDSVTGGPVPLNINDSATTDSSTTNTSYLYGDLLFGGTAPIEQIVTTSSGASASYLVASPQGVQGVFSSTGASLEQALYSPYGVATITSGADVTPFGFQGSYTDPTGQIYLINRYYDPTTDQFLSIDPLVDTTGQPYVYVNDNPLNATDPLGLCWLDVCVVVHAVVTAASAVAKAAVTVVHIATDVGKVVVKVVKSKVARDIAEVSLTVGAVALTVAVTVGTGGVALSAAALAASVAASAVDWNGCKSGQKLACVGAAISAVTAGAGAVDVFSVSEAASAAAKGFSFVTSGAAATVDLANLALGSPTATKH